MRQVRRLAARRIALERMCAPWWLSPSHGVNLHAVPPFAPLGFRFPFPPLARSYSIPPSTCCAFWLVVRPRVTCPTMLPLSRSHGGSRRPPTALRQKTTGDVSISRKASKVSLTRLPRVFLRQPVVLVPLPTICSVAQNRSSPSTPLPSRLWRAKAGATAASSWDEGT